MNINKNSILRVLKIIAGSLIYSIGVNVFIIPHKFLGGGVAGIAIILQYLTEVPSGYWVILINIPIFLIGIRVVDKQFGFYSFLGMVSMSMSLILTRNLSLYYSISDLFISSLCGGLLTGIGAGLIFRNRASQGGTDIIAVVIKKKYGLPIGKITFVINIAIVSLGIYIGGLEIAVYTLIDMYISSVVVDKLIQGIDREKMVLIVSQNSDAIKQAIINKIGRGVTFLYGEGAYTGDKKKIIYCILTSRDIQKAKSLIENIDRTAILTVVGTEEVNGNGFKATVF